MRKFKINIIEIDEDGDESLEFQIDMLTDDDANFVYGNIVEDLEDTYEHCDACGRFYDANTTGTSVCPTCTEATNDGEK